MSSVCRTEPIRSRSLVTANVSNWRCEPARVATKAAWPAQLLWKSGKETSLELAVAQLELGNAPPDDGHPLASQPRPLDEWAARTAPHSRRWRAVAAASVGNALEWYDFVIYGYFATTIAKLFFPSKNDMESLLIALGTFGITFFIRPLGAIVLGAFADRHGRKAAFMLAIGLMMLGTAIIAVIPTYAVIGAFAPIAIVLARLIQGISAGGGFGSATAFLAEQDSQRRGFFASWQFASQGLTTVIAAASGVILTG